jgi:hypothetical protein
LRRMRCSRDLFAAGLGYRNAYRLALSAHGDDPPALDPQRHGFAASGAQPEILEIAKSARAVEAVQQSRLWRAGAGLDGKECPFAQVKELGSTGRIGAFRNHYALRRKHDLANPLHERNDAKS